jgi:hypothetical protein
MRPHEVSIPPGAGFADATLRGDVDVDVYDAKPHPVAVRPLVVVEERPRDVPSSFGACRVGSPAI